MLKLQNYINGELVAPQTEEYLENYHPASGKVYSLIPRSRNKDVETAVAAAQKAAPNWAKLSRTERSGFLLKIAEKIEEKLEELAVAESQDNGKPLKLAQTVDIPRAAQNFRFFATAILHEQQEAYQTDQIAINYTQRRPLGVVACISPWNLPLYLFTWKIAPALAAGNAVVAKPSEVTPMTAYLLSKICQEVALPAGVLNIVHGLGQEAGAAMVAHPKVKAVSFTGGTKTGAEIARVAAPQFKKLSLELGGKNPNIIFADAPYEEMLETTLRSSFANQGQICLCGSRILVEASIYERFKTDFIARVKQLKVGNPQHADSDLGAVVSASHQQKILEYIALAQQEGGKVLCGGKALSLSGECAEGYFVQPTVIEGLAINCRTNQEEIFGPVVTLMPFATEAEALALANGTSYGLAATLWTNNLTRAHRLAAEIEAGIVWVNCWMLRDLRTPFGGVKNSGVGREGGFEVLRFFSETKNVCVKL